MVTVFNSTPASDSHSDSVEKISIIGSPAEKPNSSMVSVRLSA